MQLLMRTHTDRQTNGRTGGRTDGRTDGQKDMQTGRQTQTHTHIPTHTHAQTLSHHIRVIVFSMETGHVKASSNMADNIRRPRRPCLHGDRDAIILVAGDGQDPPL